MRENGLVPRDEMHVISLIHRMNVGLGWLENIQDEAAWCGEQSPICEAAQHFDLPQAP